MNTADQFNTRLRTAFPTFEATNFALHPLRMGLGGYRRIISIESGNRCIEHTAGRVSRVAWMILALTLFLPVTLLGLAAFYGSNQAERAWKQYKRPADTRAASDPAERVQRTARIMSPAITATHPAPTTPAAVERVVEERSFPTNEGMNPEPDPQPNSTTYSTNTAQQLAAFASKELGKMHAKEAEEEAKFRQRLVQEIDMAKLDGYVTLNCLPAGLPVYRNATLDELRNRGFKVDYGLFCGQAELTVTWDKPQRVGEISVEIFPVEFTAQAIKAEIDESLPRLVNKKYIFLLKELKSQIAEEPRKETYVLCCYGRLLTAQEVKNKFTKEGFTVGNLQSFGWDETVGYQIPVTNPSLAK